MTTAATIRLGKEGAATLAAAISADPVLGEEAVDRSEVAPGRWEVVVYFAAKPNRRQHAALERHGTFAIAELPDTDWVAKSLEGLKPVRAGRFVVHGRHHRDAVRPNDIAIDIEAGQAFGTGHHGTTAGCLMAIDRLARSRRIQRALDVGTGSGVLAIAIARAAKARVLASDIDPVDRKSVV